MIHSLHMIKVCPNLLFCVSIPSYTNPIVGFTSPSTSYTLMEPNTSSNIVLVSRSPYQEVLINKHYVLSIHDIPFPCNDPCLSFESNIAFGVVFCFQNTLEYDIACHKPWEHSHVKSSFSKRSNEIKHPTMTVYEYCTLSRFLTVVLVNRHSQCL